MLSISEGNGVRRRSLAVLASLAVAITGLLCISSGAKAAELVFWNNYRAEPQTIGIANADGSGGGLLNLGGLALLGPEGMAIDTARGRLFVANVGETGNPGFIATVNLDGSGASVFAPPGAPVDAPEGIAVDPVTQMVFWANTGTEPSKGSIAWAKLDGSVGGTLNTAGATLDAPYRLGVDPATGRVFWANTGGPTDIISYANENNTGGGDLDISGATPPESPRGFAVDSAAGKLYWLEGKKDFVSFANVGGGGGGDIALTGAAVESPYGLALDPSLGRLYWGNYGNKEDRIGAIGLASLSGVGGGINIASAPLSGPQDPQILKSPTGTGVPTVSRSTGSRSALECSTGIWAADYAGGFVYQAPTTYTYQWSKDGKPLSGATATTLKAKSAGKYSCVVTAANLAGATPQTSVALNVKKTKLKLTTKKKASTRAGKLATFKVKAVNQGDLKSGNARVCVKLLGPARKALKAPKCKKLGKLAGAKKKVATLKVRVGSSADHGTYKLKFLVKGAPGKAAQAKVVVVG